MQAIATSTCEGYAGPPAQFCHDKPLPHTGADLGVFFAAAVGLVALGAGLRKLTARPRG